jgi:endonuclease YncB( thermonuclease family)
MTSLFNIFSNSHTQFVPHDSENTTLSFEDESSPDHPRTPTLLRRSGVLIIYCVHSSLRKYYNNLTSCIGCSGASAKHVVEPVHPSKNEHKDNSINIDNNIQQPNHIMSVPRPLDDILYADTQIYIPNIKSGKVVKVYDADTITVANRISVGGAQSDEIYRFQVRLNGIDSPEIKSKNATTKAIAKQSRDVLTEMIFGKIVELRNVQLEKYGRLLADVYLGDLHLNEWLVENKYAVRYDGGTKQIPDEWEA